MKSLAIPFFSLFAGVLLMVACQPERLSPQEELAGNQKTDLCQYSGTVVAGDCGLFIEMDNGQKIFVRDTKGIDLKEGMSVELGYVIVQSNSQNSNHNSSGSGSCGNNNSSHASSGDELLNCMSTQGVQEGQLNCIRITDNGDETTG